jgi:hypothetical protein
MKKIILSVVVTLFLTTAFAAEKPSNEVKALNETYKKIAKLLNDYSAVSRLDHEAVVKVRIAINENNEMVVLSTNSVNEDLNYYIKNTLNYKKLSAEELGANRGLVFLVKFTK